MGRLLPYVLSIILVLAFVPVLPWPHLLAVCLGLAALLGFDLIRKGL